jgi:hypothetical protein
VDVAGWLRSLGLERYAPVFRGNEITAARLPTLTDRKLRELGLLAAVRKTILNALSALPAEDASASATRAGGSAVLRRQRKLPRPLPNVVSSPWRFAIWWARPRCRHASAGANSFST